MNKIIFFILTLMPISAFANIEPDSTPMNLEQLPQPDGGIRVVPRSQMSSTDAENKEASKEWKEMKAKGFIEKDTTLPRYLLSIKYNGPIEIKANAVNSDPYSTHMRSKASDIKLAFKYNEIPLSKDTKIIGYAPIGTWRDGWTGVKVFFENNKLGICAYSQRNMSLTHGAVNISEEAARYDINKYPNILSVEGNINSGFIYNIAWYDATFARELECANKAFEPAITKNLIEYAKLIDGK